MQVKLESPNIICSWQGKYSVWNMVGKTAEGSAVEEWCISGEAGGQTSEDRVRAGGWELGESLAGDLCSGAVQNGEDAGALRNIIGTVLGSDIWRVRYLNYLRIT